MFSAGIKVTNNEVNNGIYCDQNENIYLKTVYTST